MATQDFIKNDPVTNNILAFLGGDANHFYTVEEIAEDPSIGATTKQVQMVMSLLMREGMVRTVNKGGKLAYKLK